MDKVKVLHFELSENIGGIESFLLNLYSMINREKFQFDFVTTAEKAAYGEQLKKLGGNIYKVSDYKNILNYKSDIRNLLKNNYDVVHVHKNSATNIIPLLEAKRVGGSKIIVHSHNTSPSRGRITGVLHKINQNKLYALTDYHLACSRVAGKWMYGEKNFEVIRNGIDVAKFIFDDNKRRDIREKFGILENSIVIGNVGRFTEQKNQMRLLDIFHEIVQCKPDSKLLLVGDGPLKKKCKEKARDLGIDRNVIFLGNRSDVNDLMQAMDVFVMPSLFEGLPIAAVEAQASGTYLFLSDTISSETEISKNVSWFTLNQSDEEIARMIVKRGVPNESVRLQSNLDVIKSGFAMTTTSKRMEEIYLSK